MSLDKVSQRRSRIAGGGLRARRLTFESLEDRRLLAVLTDSMIVGGVSSDAAKVFLRVNAAASVAVEYSLSESFAASTTTTVKNTAAASDFTAILPLTDLSSETQYFYRAVIDGVPVNAGVAHSFVTFADPGAATEFSFAVVADFKNAANNPNAGVPAYESIAAGDHEFLMQLGDFDHRNPSSLASMRTMHRQMRNVGRAAGADFTEFIAPNLPLVSIWDDHDFGANNADKNFPGKAAALQAYNEYFPTVERPNSAGIWHSFEYGPAEFFMLDVRSQRDPSTQPDGPNKSMLDGNLIANDQLDWLKAGLLSSTATWKFIASGVAFNSTTKPADSWGAYGRERQELVDFINNNGITGVIFLSGDLHSGGAIDDGTNSDFPEMSVPHANLNPSSFSSGPPGTWSEGIDSGNTPGGFATVRVTAESVVLQTRAENGTVKRSLTLSLGIDSQGPATSNVIVSPNTATMGPLSIGAMVNDTNTGGSTVVAAEYFIDTAGSPGSGMPLAAADGQFNSPSELVVGTLSSSTFAGLAAGEHTIFVRGRDAAGNWGALANETFVKEAGGGGSQIVYRINAGGAQQTANPVWAADTAASPSPFSNFATGNHGVNSTTATINMTNSSIPAGTPMAVFQTNRVDKAGGSEMQWNFPVAPGQYEVRLYFAETFSGAFSVGFRKFDVVIEGAVVLNDYDIFADVGARTGVVKFVAVTADSNLDLDFFHVSSNPWVSGIEIVSLGGDGQTAQELPVSRLPGDFDGNDIVDDNDFSIWKQSFGNAGDGLAADGNVDGIVDAVDYTLWRNNLGNSRSSSGGGVAQPLLVVASDDSSSLTRSYLEVPVANMLSFKNLPVPFELISADNSARRASAGDNLLAYSPRSAARRSPADESSVGFLRSRTVDLLIAEVGIAANDWLPAAAEFALYETPSSASWASDKSSDCAFESFERAACLFDPQKWIPHL